MGDSRAHVKIEFQIYNSKLHKTEMSINWYPGSCDGVDDRVIEWFRKRYEEARDDWEAQIEKERSERSDVASTWIPVGERLPGDGEKVAVLASNGLAYTSGYYTAFNGNIIWMSKDGLPREVKVTHWMPLPTTPA